ncbi:MAG: S9 family peptidase [Pseudomonadales bacterium]
MNLSIEDFVRVERADTPHFSPDGKRLVYRWNRSGSPQAYVLDLESGESRQLTATDGVVYSVRRRPHSTEALFVTDDGGDEQYQLQLVDSRDGSARVLTSEPNVICNFGAFSHDGSRISYGSNRRDPRFFDVYVQDVETGEDRCVLQHDGMNVAARFTHDGTGLIISRPNLDLPGDNDLFLVESTGRQNEPRRLTPHEGAVEWTQSHTHPGGAVLALCDEGRDFRGLQRIDLVSGEREYLLIYDWDIEAVALSDDGEKLAVVINEDGTSRLEVHALTQDGHIAAQIAVPGLPDGIIAQPAWREDGLALALTFESARHIPNVWLIDLESGTAKEVTQASAGEVAPSMLPEPELIRYATFDDREIPAYYYRPLDAAPDGKLPCMVLVHGGPEAQSRPALWGRYAAPQYLLARGDIALLVPNVRGSTGYGREYSHADDVELRMDSVRDLIAAIDWLTEVGGVDPERVGVMGGSYGGFMTLAAITEAPERWGVAVDLFGIADFETFLKFTGPWRRRHRAREYGEDPAFLRTISPIHKADLIRTPLLVIQGDHDVRVPQEESEQIVDTVRRNGGIVEYIVFPEEGHGIQKLPHRLEMGKRIVAFLENHLIQR